MGAGTAPKFSLGPFDGARFASLSEGLEVRTATSAEVVRRQRLDADFFAHLEQDLIVAIEADPRVVRMSDLCNTITSGFTPKVESLAEGDVDFATIDCIAPLQLNSTNFKLIPEQDYRSGFTGSRSVSSGAVLCTIKRRICQAYPFTSDLKRPLAFNQDIALLRPDPAKASAIYLAAYLGSSIGQALANREQTEQMNPYLSLIGLGNLPVVLLSGEMQRAVERLFDAGERSRRASEAALAQAEADLLDALGLRDWSPPEPLTYTRSAAAVAAAGRLDAEFAAPRIQALLQRLGRGGTTLDTVADVRRDKFRPRPPGTFRYIEIGDLDGFGGCESSELDLAEAPSRATWHVRAGDVITSTVRPIRRLSAIVAPEQDGNVCSSGFVVLQPVRVSSELLLTYLRLPLIAELLHLFATASMYPALSETDLLALPMPPVDQAIDDAVAQSVRTARERLVASEHLLATAKRAVEIAIEDGEAAALAFVNAA